MISNACVIVLSIGMLVACSSGGSGGGTGGASGGSSGSGGSGGSAGSDAGGSGGAVGPGIQCQGGALLCDCVKSDQANTEDCSFDSVNTGNCCADPSWPSSGTCRCFHYRCETTTNGCHCSGAVGGDSTFCEGSICDGDETSCTCAEGNVPTPTSPQTSCSVGFIECAEGRVPVPDCRGL